MDRRVWKHTVRKTGGYGNRIRWAALTDRVGKSGITTSAGMDASKSCGERNRRTTAWWEKAMGPEVRAPGICSGPFHRRRAQEASAEQGQAHARALCEWPAHRRLATRSRQGTIDAALESLGLERETS